MRNLMLVCVGLVVMSAIVSLNLWQDLRHERALNVELQTQLANAGGRTPAPGMPARPTPTAGKVQAPTSAPQSIMHAAQDAFATAGLYRIWPDRLNDPVYRATFLAQARLTLARQYPGLVESLALTPEEANQLYDILSERELDRSGVSLQVEGMPEEAQREARENAFGELNRKRDEALAALLGDTRLARFEEYQQEQPAWIQVNMLNQRLTALGTPLSAGQSNALALMLAAEQKRIQDEATRMSANRDRGSAAEAPRIEAFIAHLPESHQRTLEAAKSQLTATQLEALKAMLDQQLAQARAYAGRLATAQGR